MIAAIFVAARTWFAALPPAARWLAAGVVLAAVLAAAWMLWLTIHDRAVITQHKDKREAAAAGATVKSAEERAVDALANQMARDQREAAIAVAEASEAAKAPEARATVAPQNRALNCARLKQAGLTGDAAYREACL